MWLNYGGYRLNLANVIGIYVHAGPPIHVRVETNRSSYIQFGPNFSTTQEAEDWINTMLSPREL